MKTQQRRAPRCVQIWTINPSDRSGLLEIQDALPGWHCSNLPSSPGDPLELFFFDHDAARAAVRKALAMPAVTNASPFHQFEVGRTYLVTNEAGDTGMARVSQKKRQLIEIEAVSCPHRGSVEWLPQRVKKQIKTYTAMNCQRGEYLQITTKLRVYAADDVDE